MNSVIRPYIIAVTFFCLLFNITIADRSLAQPPSVRSDQLVSIDFNNVDIVVFIKFMSDLTKKNFIIDEKVRGKVTIISPGKITVDEAYRVFLSVLEVHGYTTVPSGKITKIVPSPDARSKSIKTRLEEESGGIGDNVVTQLIPLHYADPNEIKRLFAPLVSKSSVILAYPPTNTLIITDVQSNIRRLGRIIKAIDITGVGQQIAIIPVEYADATKLVTLLSSIFKAQKGKGVIAKEITFVADERTNSIVLLASEGDTDNIRKLIRSLDKETPKGQAKIHVYYLEHANAEELADVLQNIPQKGATDPKTPGKKTAPVISDKVRISADKSTNSLIIMADAEDYVVLEDIIRKIDIPRSMVYIEALIMEVQVFKDFRLGTEWVGGGKTLNDDAIYGGAFSAGPTGGTPGVLSGTLNAAGVPLPPGFSLGLFGKSISIAGIEFPTIQAIVQAYKEDNDVNILSTPQILTTDNQEAKIYVGSNIPFQTQTTNSDSGSTLYNSFEYRDVGKTLKITPHISKDRMVRLEIALEVSSVAGTQSATPTTLKRTVETTAIVQDSNTVVLGGLIDEQLDKTIYKVPCLGDIPGLGYLFKKTSDSNDKTNLYIFLTPRVIQKPDEATSVAKEKRNEIDNLREENIKLYHRDQVDGKSQGTKESSVESFRYQEEQASLNIAAQASPQGAGTGDTTTAAKEADAATDSVQTNSAGTVSDMDRDAQVPKTTTPAAAAKESGPPKLAGGGYTIQVASVATVQQADQILKKLTDKGYPGYTVQTGSGATTQYLVRIGFYAKEKETEPLLQQLKTDNYDPVLIKF
ncbi:MAG: type II secretion system secretin GspD [Desulfobacteraceae bacterium]